MRRLALLALLPLLLPSAARAEPPPPRSTGVAVALEIVSPVGGAGCFYRRRPLPGALVVAGTLISGGMLAHALAHSDRDATIVDAVAYGVMRTIGIVAAAQPDAPPRPAALFPDPTPHHGAPPALAAPAFGLSYRFSF